MPEYESIFWEPQWVHAAYYGWRDVHRERDLVIFKKQTWGLQRFLVLTKDSSEQALAKQLHRLIRPLWRSELVIHNFDQELAQEQKVGTVCLEPLGESSRLLNQQTFVIDLGKEIFYALDDAERDGILDRLVAEKRRGKPQVTRFKGLGEMNPPQLRETTMDPNTRRLVQLTLDDFAATSEMMDMLLAKKRAPDRKSWLESKGNLAEVLG